MPSNLARRVMNDLIKYGDVQRGSIGYFNTIPLTPDIAAQLETDRTRGVVVNRMDRSGAAYEAGLRPGDIILALNDAPIADGAQLERLIADAKSGTTVRLKVARGTREMTISVPVENAAPGAAKSATSARDRPRPCPCPILSAFSLFDGKPEASEIALALAVAFIAGVAGLDRVSRAWSD